MAGDARYVIRAGCTTWRRIENQVIVLDLDQSEYFALNEAASVLWTDLAAGATVDELVASLRFKFLIDERDASSDVVAFLQDGEQRGWIVRAETELRAQ
jgi:Coenzyme PQQ synthesis protein D (PqqD)